MTSLYITESGSFLKRNGGHVVIGRNNEVLFEVPLERVEDVTLIDSINISSTLLTDFIEREVPITWLSTYGKYFGTLLNTSSVDILKHEKQFNLLNNKEFYLSLAKKIVISKVNNQITILRRYGRNLPGQQLDRYINNIKAMRHHIPVVTTSNELIGYEGITSRIYFEALGIIVPEEFRFERRSKRPPLDPFNSMLSLGYSMLFNEILAGVINAGLHPYVGCLHKLAKGHPALISDLIEEWRAPLIDSLVLSMVKRNMMSMDMFDISEKGCYVNSEGRKIFLQSYNKRLRSQNQYLDKPESYRQSIFKQCKKYASTIVNEDISLYTPVVIR